MEDAPLIAARPEDVEITCEDDVYTLTGPWLERLVSMINFSDNDSRMYFDRQLRSSGIYDRLEDLGISEGDTVSIYGLEFEYYK